MYKLCLFATKDVYALKANLCTKQRSICTEKYALILSLFLSKYICCVGSRKKSTEKPDIRLSKILLLYKWIWYKRLKNYPTFIGNVIFLHEPYIFIDLIRHSFHFSQCIIWWFLQSFFEHKYSGKLRCILTYSGMNACIGYWTKFFL